MINWKTSWVSFCSPCEVLIWMCVLVFSRLLTNIKTGHSLTLSWLTYPKIDTVNRYHPQLLYYVGEHARKTTSSAGRQHKASVTDICICPVVSPTVIRNSSNTPGEFACLPCFGKKELSSCERRLCSNFLLSTARQWIWLFIIEEGWVRTVAFPVQQEQHKPCFRFLWEFPWSCRFQTRCMMLLWENVDV